MAIARIEPGKQGREKIWRGRGEREERGREQLGMR
jgi:hypothetical protein